MTKKNCNSIRRNHFRWEFKLIRKIHLRKYTKHLIIWEARQKGESHHQSGEMYNSVATHSYSIYILYIDLVPVRSFISLTIDNRVILCPTPALKPIQSILYSFLTFVRTLRQMRFTTDALSSRWQSGFFPPESNTIGILEIRNLTYLPQFCGFVI